jgi:hypothetical protein
VAVLRIRFQGGVPSCAVQQQGDNRTVAIVVLAVLALIAVLFVAFGVPLNKPLR